MNACMQCNALRITIHVIQVSVVPADQDMNSVLDICESLTGCVMAVCRLHCLSPKLTPSELHSLVLPTIMGDFTK